MSLLLRRRSAADAASSSSTSASNNDNEKAKKIQANQALQSMQYCIKMCFFSVCSSLLITFIDSNIRSRFFTSLTWVDYAEIFDSLSLLFFGGGLWRVSQLYWKSFTNPNERMGHDNLLELFGAMSWIWGIVAFNMAFVCVFMAASLPIHGSEGPFAFLLERVTSRQLGLGVVGIFGVGGVVVQGICEKRAVREGKAYRERNNHGAVQQQQQQPLRNSKLDKVREAGFRAYCNQALCAGSFGVMAILEWIRWLVSIQLHVGGGSIIGHIFSVSDFITPFVITALLLTLNRAFVRAAIAEVGGHSDDDDDGDAEIFNDLFVAQTRFYDEAAKTMKTATTFSLLPYAVTPAIPFLLKALEKISPSFFSKIIEVFAIKM